MSNQIIKECLYCRDPATYSPIEGAEKLGIKIYFCYPCQAEFTFSEDYISWTQSLYTTINGKAYRCGGFTGSDTFTIWIIKKPGVPGLFINKDMKCLMTFKEGFSNINPDNVKDKIKTCLMFQ